MRIVKRRDGLRECRADIDGARQQDWTAFNLIVERADVELHDEAGPEGGVIHAQPEELAHARNALREREVEVELIAELCERSDAFQRDWAGALLLCSEDFPEAASPEPRFSRLFADDEVAGDDARHCCLRVELLCVCGAHKNLCSLKFH